MERKIGEIFEYNGEWYQCVEGKTICSECDLRNIICQRDTSIDNPFKECSGNYRTDKKNIIFKKLEKVGEPYMLEDKKFQKYRVFHTPYIYNKIDYSWRSFADPYYISLEIKQSKEDMEEKKQCGDARFRIIARAKEHLFQATNITEDKKELEVLDCFLLRCWQMGWLKQYEDAEEKKLNLKPFDLQKAREGKPVCTRDGRKARIICFDREFIHEGQNYCIVALIKDGSHSESLYSYTEDGLFSSNKIHNYDLMMLPERKEGWINIYNADTTFYYADGRVFETKDEAVQEAKEKVEKEQREKNEYVDTIKITWEE